MGSAKEADMNKIIAPKNGVPITQKDVINCMVCIAILQAALLFTATKLFHLS